MQKLLKTKPNYKKFLSDKDLSHKYDYKHSQTLSTNESKIHHESEKQTLNNFRPVDTRAIMHKNLTRYSTSDDLFYLTGFQTMYNQSRTRQKILLADVGSFKDEELMDQCYPAKKSVAELSQLFQYYKYYINNPIIFGKEHFKMVYNFYEKKKYLQYKRLKAVLDLDDGKDSLSENTMNDNVSADPKRSSNNNSKTFYIMNLIQTQSGENSNRSESKAFLQLNSDLQEMLSHINNSKASTPIRYNQPDSGDKNLTLFKKKKISTPYQPLPFKNTILKKTKKHSVYNSSSSIKQVKCTKAPKEPYLSKFNLQTIQFSLMKTKCQISHKKLRHASNLSMGELDVKTNNFTIVSPKKYYKKRLNSCETIISRNYSREKGLNEKNILKPKGSINTRFRQEKSQHAQLEDFKNYLKRASVNFRKSAEKPGQRVTEKPVERVTEKGAKSGISSHSSKFREYNSPKKADSNILIKKLKKKGPLRNYSAKNSQEKSPHHGAGKQQLIEESILNLKKKIRMAKETIKCATPNNSSVPQTQKGRKG